MEEITRTACFFLFVVWGLSLVAGLGLLFKNYFLALDSQFLSHIFTLSPLNIIAVRVFPGANVCIAILPRIWENWIPIMLEHAIFFLFLLARSFQIPRCVLTKI